MSPRMRGALLLVLSATVLLAWSALAAPLSPIAFSEPVKLNPFGAGYEPGIDVDSQGTLYVTAHKASIVVEGTRLSSWLWYSDDDGATWNEMPSPLQTHDKLFAFEGDLALDALDRLYYVDTLLADNTITRWSPGPTWDYSLPLQRTSLLDDRPWISAHGDGIVYYIGNSALVAGVFGTEDLTEGSTTRGRYHFYRSEDGGLTWTIDRVLPNSGWCGVEASRLDDSTVYTVCINDVLVPNRVYVQESHDRGETFAQTRVGTLGGTNLGYPTITVDGGSNVYAAWGDTKPGTVAKLMVARSTPELGWTTLQVPTTVGTVSRPWIDSGSEGVVAVAYYGTADTRTSASTDWRTYVAVSSNADEAVPTWDTVELSGVVQTSASAPADFMQVVVGPDDRAHVVFGKSIAAPDPLHVVDYNQDIYYVGQV